MLDCKEKTVTLLSSPTNPVSNELFLALARETFSMLEQDFKAGELIGVTGENKRAEMPLLTLAANGLSFAHNGDL